MILRASCLVPLVFFGCTEPSSELLGSAHRPGPEAVSSSPDDGISLADGGNAPSTHNVDASDEGGGTLPPAPGSGLCGPCTTSGDCTAGRACLMFTGTNERFCAQDCANSPCPSGYACSGFATPTGALFQCVPAAGSCKGQPAPAPTPTPASDSGAPSPGAPTAGGDLQHCVDVINSHRAKVGAAPLARSSALETYAAAGAASDSQTNQPHGHFMATAGGGVAFAENEIPGWPLSSYMTVTNVIDRGTLLMWNEGPGGGHYENLVNRSFTQVGCGIHTTATGAVWLTQDFR